MQNIGAYGLEIAERVSDVECFDPATGEPLTLTADDCDYGYRTSVFKTKRPDLIVLSVTLALPKTFEPRTAYKELAAVFGERVPADANELAEAVKSVRRKKLPDPKVLGNAGSFLKTRLSPRSRWCIFWRTTRRWWLTPWQAAAQSSPQGV